MYVNSCCGNKKVIKKKKVSYRFIETTLGKLQAKRTHPGPPWLSDYPGGKGAATKRGNSIFSRQLSW